MENPYKNFIIALFRMLESDARDRGEWEALVSRDDSPIKVGIDTATGKAIIVTDPAFLKSVASSRCEDFKRHLIEALEETARNRLNMHA